MGEARSTYRGEKGCIGVSVGKPEGRSHFEDPGVDGRIILIRIFRKWDGAMDWIDLAKDRYRWCALVNEVMKLRVP